MIKKLALLLFLTISSCGIGTIDQPTASISQADGTPDFPISDAPSHDPQPGQPWPYQCAISPVNYPYCYSNGVYNLGTYPSRCPCIINAPPGCRIPPAGTIGTRLSYGESRMCTGQNLTGNCIIIKAGTRLDYWWMALAGFESKNFDGTLTGPLSFQSGARTQTVITFTPDGFTLPNTNFLILGGGNFSTLVTPPFNFSGIVDAPNGWITQVYSRLIP